MTFLAPWTLFVGALAAVGLVAMHLVARQRPAAYPLPTARFVPDRRTLVSRVARRPRDLLLLLLRVLLVLSAAAAFARPVLTPRRAPLARVLILDRSAAVADRTEALQRAREILSDGVPTQLLAFDTSTAVIGLGAAALDSLARAPQNSSRAPGSLSAALAAARRVGADAGARADSIELVLVSPVTERQMDAASDSIRASWLGAMRIVRVRATVDSVTVPPIERAPGDADVLGPALRARAVSAAPNAVRIVRGALSANDSAFAQGGGVVVRWDSLGSRAQLPSAVAMGDDVIVAMLGRNSLTAGAVVARWADGRPAAVEQSLGAGCVRVVGIAVPAAGELPLTPVFHRMVDGLTGSCTGARTAVGAPLAPARVAELSGPRALASGSALANGLERPTPIAPWLLGLALACAMGELLLRYRGEPKPA